MVLTIKNFESQNVGPGVVETAPTNLVGVAGTLKATLTWTSATGESGVTWTEEKLVRKEGSAPAGSMDGITVATITTKDTYATNGYEDTGLDSTKTYYYKVFAVYDNGTERGSTDVNVTPDGVPTESIMIKMMAGNDGTLKVPVAGVSITGNKNCPYNREVSVDGGTPTNYNGTGSTTPITMATGLTAGSEHTVMITPTTEAYGWARAFGFASSGIANLLIEVIYDGSYMGYGVSATQTGDNFRGQQYRGCTNLKTASEELLPNTVTTIGNNFRGNQYNGCTGLTTIPAEVIPNSVTSIGVNFRDSQYYGCTGLTTAPAEALPNSITSIGEWFRYQQYLGCTGLTTAPEEVMPNTVTTIGQRFRSGQYSGCTALTTAPAEVISNSITNIGVNFRASQYYGCTGLTTVTGIQATPTSVTKGTSFRNSQFSSAGNTTNKMNVIINGTNIETGSSNSLGLANTKVNQIKVDASLVTAYQSSSDWSNITDSKFVAL